eukprot:1606619-Rhodomonas_salina.1
MSATGVQANSPNLPDVSDCREAHSVNAKTRESVLCSKSESALMLQSSSCLPFPDSLTLHSPILHASQSAEMWGSPSSSRSQR